MERIRVELAARSYDVMIDAGLLDRAGEHLASHARDGAMIVVSDSHVWAAQGARFEAGMARAGIRLDPILLPPGEGTKSWDQLAKLCDALLARGVERKDHIIALGGGVIGDLVGFAASILKRGCNFVQIPTSLLAQVDSSVGGKTAINTNAGKNLIGAFHQPALVLIDPRSLDTLPVREVRAGYAEVVKYGLIDDPAFFGWCENHGVDLLKGDPDARSYAIAKSVAAKAAIVAADERETDDKRALLNLGHTFGHALEAETGFSARMLHGEAVAAGVALAYRFSASLGFLPDADADRVAAHLAATGLPFGLSGFTASGADLVAHMLHDKKRSGGTLPFILAKGIGRAYVDKSVALERVAEFLDGEGR